MAIRRKSANAFGLTRREREVLSWVIRGKTNPEIGKILNTSPRTVGKHLERIYEKLEVPTRTAAVTKALRRLGRD
jgi:DNA-binding CsgD family transcriptional regulator